MSNLDSKDDVSKKNGNQNSSQAGCCGCNCNWSQSELASFLRHLASFFDRKK